MTSPRWQNWSFLILLLLTRTTNNYSPTIHHWENPRTRSEAESPACTRHQDRLYENNERSSYTPTTLPLPQAGQRNLGDNHPHSTGLALWDLLLSSYPMGIARESATTGNLTMIEKGREGGNNQHMDLSKSNLFQQCPSSNNNQQLCSFAEPSLGSTLNRELRRMKICLIWILKRCLEPGLPTPLTTMCRSSRQAIRKQQIWKKR